jgi:hypothetical protein
MLLQAVAAIVLLVWLCSGTAGLKQGFTVGALLVVGLAVKRFLDFYWKPKTDELPRRETYNPRPFSLPSRSSRGSLPSPNWGLSPFSTGRESSGSNRFGRKLAWTSKEPEPAD